jgi:PAS domain S-box-containing protein
VLSQGVQLLLDSLPLAVIACDPERRIVAANPSAQALFHYRLEQLLGQPLEILLPPHLAHRHAEHFQRFQDQPGSRVMGQGRELTARRSDGQELPVEVGLTVLSTVPTTYLASIVDLTLGQRVERLLRHQQEGLRQSLGQLRGCLEQQLATRSRLEERQRFARELNDTLSQTLYSIGLGLRTALRQQENSSPELRQSLTYCQSLAEAALQQLQALHPSEESDPGLPRSGLANP